VPRGPPTSGPPAAFVRPAQALALTLFGPAVCAGYRAVLSLARGFSPRAGRDYRQGLLLDLRVLWERARSAKRIKRTFCQSDIQRGSTIALARSASYVFIPIFFLIDLKIFSKQKQYAVY
jgi:hypothetical protein